MNPFVIPFLEAEIERLTAVKDNAWAEVQKDPYDEEHLARCLVDQLISGAALNKAIGCLNSLKRLEG